MAPPAAVDKTAYERERDARVQANKLKMQELGLDAVAAEMAAETARPAKTMRKKREKVPEEQLERRVSFRERKPINYCEMMERAAREAREPVDHSARIAAVSLDAETAEKLRAEMEEKRGSAPKSGKSRGPVDSGKGVRIQGGRVYDSKHGVTCHWCRQKTLEEHVTCTNPNCGHGKRMPLSFCAKCLRNRHGEDFSAAENSGGWWCPSCRGSCGPGCVICCNCGPCRKRAGLDPTHQVVKLARDAGFCNVHDYLVHLVTGEDHAALAARKLKHAWGAWMRPDASDASEQTGGGSERGAEDEQAEEAQLQEQDVAPAGDDQGNGRARRGAKGGARRGKAAKPSPATTGRGRKRRADAPAEATETNNTSKEQQVSTGGRVAGAAAAAAAPTRASNAPPCAATTTTDSDEDEGDTLTEAPLLSSQDNKLSRKQRIMQRMGLAPVSVC